MIHKHYQLVDGSLGKWKDTPYHIDLVPNAQSYHARAYPIPCIYENTLRLGVKKLYQLGVLKKVNRSQ